MYYENFEKLCKRDGIKPAKVSRDTGISSATLTSWKKGEYTPKSDKLQIIADYFDVSIEYIMGSENYSFDKEINTWVYNVPQKDMQLLIEVMSDNDSASRLITYAKKLIELKSLENI